MFASFSVNFFFFFCLEFSFKSFFFVLFFVLVLTFVGSLGADVAHMFETKLSFWFDYKWIFHSFEYFCITSSSYSIAAELCLCLCACFHKSGKNGISTLNRIASFIMVVTAVIKCWMNLCICFNRFWKCLLRDSNEFGWIIFFLSLSLSIFRFFSHFVSIFSHSSLSSAFALFFCFFYAVTEPAYDEII